MKIQHGDILIYHSHSVISLCIQFFMNMWRWVNFRFKPFYDTVPNHAGMGEKYNHVVEALANGIVDHPIEDIIKDKMTGTIKVYRYFWSIRQRGVINLAYKRYIGTPYQYVNFLQYIVYILTFGTIWIGTKGDKTDSKLYCSEFVANIMYRCTEMGLAKSPSDEDAHKYFRDYWKISPYVLERWCAVNCQLVNTYHIEKGVVVKIT